MAGDRTWLIGLAGGLLGGLTMNAFTRVVSTATEGNEAEGVAPGGDRVGRGMQPPQSAGRADEDAAVRAGSIAYRAVTGEKPDRATKRRLGTLAHYAFSGAAGVCYALLAERATAVRAGFGTFYGGMVWAVADEGITPALGLSRGPGQLSAGAHLYSLAGHCVYGATLEAVRRVAIRP